MKAVDVGIIGDLAKSYEDRIEVLEYDLKAYGGKNPFIEGMILFANKSLKDLNRIIEES